MNTLKTTAALFKHRCEQLADKKGFYADIKEGYPLDEYMLRCSFLYNKPENKLDRANDRLKLDVFLYLDGDNLRVEFDDFEEMARFKADGDFEVRKFIKRKTYLRFCENTSNDYCFESASNLITKVFDIMDDANIFTKKELIKND